MSFVLGIVGCFFFAIVVSIYAGLWLHDEKMYYAQGLPAQLFGAIGVLFGLPLAWLIYCSATSAFGRRHSTSP